MSTIAIRVEQLGKKFLIGRKREKYFTLREYLSDSITSSVTRAKNVVKGETCFPKAMKEWFWALKDTNLEIQQGEVVGIIGANGAGKSTLLKILSRITEPTEGFADIRGRVRSLLEVGTGFHYELTGRENIYLNGAILGMKKYEITRKFDEIVAFSGIEQFIDTPVKRYSSGMYLRLAFAVAAHLQSEILLVDEVLAVGDADFQKKCLNKMEDIGRGGRTVVFISHNMSAITRLCSRAFLLDEGRILQSGPSGSVVRTYLTANLGSCCKREWRDRSRAPGNHVARLCAVRLIAENGEKLDSVDIRKTVGIQVEFDVLRPGQVLWPHFLVHNEERILAFVGIDHDPQWKGRPRPVGRYRSTGWIPGNFLSEGTMLISPGLKSVNPEKTHFFEREAIAFQVVDTVDGDSVRGEYGKNIPGVVRPMLKWTTHFELAETES